MYGSETWPMNAEHETMLSQTEMSMTRWLCEVKLNERKTSEDISTLQGSEPVSLMKKKSGLRIRIGWM